MSFPIDWTGTPDDDSGNPYFPDVPGWTKVIKGAPGTIEDRTDASFRSDTLIPWTNISNAADNDGTHSASVVVTVGVSDGEGGATGATTSDLLYAHDWGFAIPDGATIQAVMVAVNGTMLLSTAPDEGAKLLLDPFCLNVDGEWVYEGGDSYSGWVSAIGPYYTPPGTDTPGTNFINGIGVTTYPGTQYALAAAGGWLPLMGASGITLSPAQVNAAGFGPAFSAYGWVYFGGTTGTRTINLYAMAMAVYYTVPGGPAILPPVRMKRLPLTVDLASCTYDQQNRLLQYEIYRALGPDPDKVGITSDPWKLPYTIVLRAWGEAVDDVWNILKGEAGQPICGRRITIDASVSPEWAGDYEIIEMQTFAFQGDASLMSATAGTGSTLRDSATTVQPPSADSGTLALTLRTYSEDCMVEVSDEPTYATVPGADLAAGGW
jgi:hypothetical protein